MDEDIKNGEGPANNRRRSDADLITSLKILLPGELTQSLRLC
jgi:hypothetical protein